MGFILKRRVNGSDVEATTMPISVRLFRATFRANHCINSNDGIVIAIMLLIITVVLITTVVSTIITMALNNNHGIMITNMVILTIMVP